MHRNSKFVKIAARVVAFLLALLFVGGAFLYVFATPAEPYPLPTPLSENLLIYNLQHDKVLYEKNAQNTIFPASFAKIMTAILSYEYLADLGAAPTVTATDVEALPSTGIPIEEGEIFPFEALLNAMVVGSANNAAVLLARTVSGSEEAFVARMNERAAELGCTNTYFANPTGAHDNSAHTTLTDMAKICARAYEINDYMLASSLLYYEVAPTNLREKNYRVYTKNLLLNPRTDEGYGYYVEGAMGINCGSTAESGFCAASVRETDNAINLVLVSGGYKDSANYNTALLDAKELFDYAEHAFALKTVLSRESIVKEVAVRLSDTHDHVLLVAGNELSSLLPIEFNPETDLEQRIYLTEETLEAPIVEGTAYGSIEIYYKGELIGQTELVAQRSLSRSTSLALMDGVQNFLRIPAVRFTLITLAIVIVSFLAVCVVLLLIQQQRKKGSSAKERRERRRLERELIQKEKIRQEEYFREGRKLRRQRTAEAIREFREARERYYREQEAAERRAEERARQARRAEQARRPQQPRPQQPQRPPQKRPPQGK